MQTKYFNPTILFNTPVKITLKQDDARLIITPLKYFTELQKAPIYKRKKDTIFNDRTLLFAYLDFAHPPENFMDLEKFWVKR